LGVVDRKGGHSPNRSGKETYRGVKEAAGHEEDQRGGKNAHQEGEEADGERARPLEEYPEVEKQIVEGRVDIDGRASQYGGDIADGEIDRPPLIPPKGLKVQPGDTESEGQKGD